MSQQALFEVPPTELAQARTLSHAAVQWPSRAARANLEPAADDSHSNLGWIDEIQGFVSRLLDRERRYQLGFSFSSGSLLWLVGGDVAATLKLESAGEFGARVWCDAQLAEAGLQTTDRAEMPYDLGPVDYAGFGGAGQAAALKTLGAWYSMAQHVLENLVQKFQGAAVSMPAIRCWPHHYDLATLFSLEAGDPETARSIGVGLSPGDEGYAEPYFYCSPWPAPESLPEAPAPLHWHTAGFTSLVCPASRLNEKTDLDRVLTSAFELARDTLRGAAIDGQ